MIDEGTSLVNGMEDVEADIKFHGINLMSYTDIVTYVVPARIIRVYYYRPALYKC